MANTNSPNGLQAVYNSALESSKFTPYYIDASQAAMAIGTPVALGGASNTANVIYGQEYPAGTLPTIVLATGGDTHAFIGSIVGFASINTSNLLPTAVYNAANTAAVALVADSPDTEFTILDNGTNALATTDIGANLNLTIGTVNTSTGVDSTTLASASPNTTSTFQVKLLRLNNRPNNTIGAVNAEYIVKINNHQLANGTAGL